MVLMSCASVQAPAVATIELAGPAIVRDSETSGPDVQAAAYVRLRNATMAPDRLVALDCTCAREVQIHSTFDRSMHTLPHLDIAAGGELEIAPGGPTHLMLMGVTEPIQPGETVRMRLRFATAPPLEIDFVAVGNSREGWIARDR